MICPNVSINPKLLFANLLSPVTWIKEAYSTRNTRRQNKVCFGVTNTFYALQDRDVDSYLDSQGLSPDQCWRSKYEVFPTTDEFNRMLKSCCKDAASKVVASFMEMLLRNGKTLETFVVKLKYIDEFDDDPKWFEELLQIPPTLCNNNNVSIVLKRYFG
ncbi:unnamed protein product [Thlaspi arvense]|uniref:Uncharacterized protein n=1 Tax=Thlaspi arvense TaxID=13288 RepID=A0AAU9RTP9_THLAR|nr:unnamed protein product [Thlaspi arvense]